jgi:fumarylacetoacetate (FAA) hydrolase family protein
MNLAPAKFEFEGSRPEVFHPTDASACKSLGIAFVTSLQYLSTVLSFTIAADAICFLDTFTPFCLEER